MRSVNFSAGSTIPQEAEHLLRQALWEGPGEFYVEHLVINCAICPTEIEGKEDELVGGAFVLRSASRLRRFQPSCAVWISRARLLSSARPRREPSFSGGIIPSRSAMWVSCAETIRSANFARWLGREIG